MPLACLLAKLIGLSCWSFMIQFDGIYIFTIAVRLETVEAFCGEPGCMKYFTNEQCLKAHIQTCHQYINCEICGGKQLKKNIKRHLRTHEKDVSKERIRCSFEECDLTFSTVRNMFYFMD